MKILKLSAVSIIIIVTIVGVIWPIPTIENYDKETFPGGLADAVEAHHRNMAIASMATTTLTLLLLIPASWSAKDTFAKYSYASCVVILLFAYFANINELIYTAIVLVAVSIIYDIIVNNMYENEDKEYEERVKNRTLNKAVLSEKRKKIFKNRLSSMSSRKQRKYKDRF